MAERYAGGKVGVTSSRVDGYGLNFRVWVTTGELGSVDNICQLALPVEIDDNQPIARVLLCGILRRGKMKTYLPISEARPHESLLWSP